MTAMRFIYMFAIDYLTSIAQQLTTDGRTPPLDIACQIYFRLLARPSSNFQQPQVPSIDRCRANSQDGVKRQTIRILRIF